MKTTTTESEAYLEAVRVELDDLPEEERIDLLEDLAQHLADVTAHQTEGAPDLAALLGPPARYAAELRAAAELPPRVERQAAATKESLSQRLGRSWPARLGLAVWRRPSARAVRDFVPQLRPAWWVLRGYLLVAVPSSWSADRTGDFPIPAVSGSHTLGLLLAAAAVVASVRLGRSALGKRLRYLVIAGNTLLVFLSLGLLGQADARVAPSYAFESTSAPFPFELQSAHGPVTNIFPYSADGKPLDGVLLFDQDGRPLRTAMQKWWADGCERVISDPGAADGVGVDFAYPKNYVVTNSKPGAPCRIEGYRPDVPMPAFPEKPAAPEASIKPAFPDAPLAPLPPIAPQAKEGSAAAAPEAEEGAQAAAQAPVPPGNAEATASPALPGNAEATASPAPAPTG